MLARKSVHESVAGASVTASSSTQREAAFRRLAEVQLEASYQLANAILGDRSDARDAVHDAFIRAWQSWPSLRDPERFEWWFKRIVVNTCRNRLRDGARRRHADLVDQAWLASADHSPRSTERIVVEQALASLKADDRVVLALRYYRDLQLAEIAELLGVPTGTVKSRLNAAHGRLRAVVVRLSPEGTSS